MNQFSLNEIYPHLHTSDEVKAEVARSGQEKLSDPNEKIDIYLRRFEHILEREDDNERQRGISAVKKWAIDKFVTKYEDVKDNYWKFQEKILLERGEAGNWESLNDNIKENFKRQHFESLAGDQAQSLSEWIDYFASPDSKNIDSSIKYWAFRSILNLQEFDPHTHKFPNRSNGTLKMFPNLDREALGYINDAVNGKEFDWGYDINANERDEFENALKNKNFAELYSFFVDRIKPIPESLLQKNDGKWVKYQKGSDGLILSNDVRQRSTGWCTAGVATAQTQ